MTNPVVAKREALLRRLLDQGEVSAAEVVRAEAISERNGDPVELVLNQIGVLSDDRLADAYATAAGCSVWDAVSLPLDETAAALPTPNGFLKRHRLLPLRVDDDRLLVAACDPLDDEGLAGLVFATGLKVEVLAARPGDWRREFSQHREPLVVAPVDIGEQRLERELDRISDTTADSAGARLVGAAIESAVNRGASDVHFEPRRHDMRIRLRLDGRLIDHGSGSLDLAAAAVARIKVLADLDLGEKRLPQDGRATFVIDGRPVEVRVSIVPTVFGEGAVLRILDRKHVQLDLASLGFRHSHTEALHKAARARHGIFLVTGPTGSGKTTTLYALLNALVGSDRKILSIEDPVEYHFDHVVQTQIAPAIGLTFASTLRAFLRQDPDVILVGEIRDAETASVAIQAAMTGHLVLASVHANDALRVVPRLLDMGVEPYQLAASFLGSAAQRLARKLCPQCRRPAPIEQAEAEFLAAQGLAPPAQVFVADGCSACGGLGTRGRIAIDELFMADEAFLRQLARDPDMVALARRAAELGLAPMLADGLEKAGEGLVSVGELMSVLGAQ